MSGITKKNVRLAQFVTQARKQKNIENFFNAKSIHKMVRDEISQSPEIMGKVADGVKAVTEWMSKDYYESKNQRLDEIALLDTYALVFDIITTIIMKCKSPMPLVNVASMCANKLKMMDQGSAIQTVAEIIAVLCETDLFDLERPNKYSQINVRSCIALCADLEERANYAQFLPPMLHRPRTLKNNRHSGYWTCSGDSLILGGYQNHHDGQLSLDVLNTQNKNCFEIDTDFISSVEETPSKKLEKRWGELDDDYDNLSREEKEMYKLEVENWDQYKLQCYSTYALMIHHGNKFHFQHKVDKRGRVYSYGYHISPQGNSFKKAMLNLAHKEVATGADAFIQGCK